MSFFPKKLPLSKYEYKISPVNGVVEEGLIEHVALKLESENIPHFCVEFGAGDGTNHSFSKNLIEKYGWGALAIEGSPTLGKKLIEKHKENKNVTALNSFITKENILELFKEGKVPKDFGFLSVDIDGNDYYILEKILEEYRPYFICVEYNAAYGPYKEFKIDYDPSFVWQNDDYIGASFASFIKLCGKFKYKNFHASTGGDNLFFVREELSNHFELWLKDPSEYYQPPQGGRFGRAPNGKGSPASKRTTTTAERLFYKLRYYVMTPPRRLYNILNGIKK